MVLGIIFLAVTILAIISIFRQMKHKNILAIIFAGLTVLVFGFFSIMTLSCELMPSLSVCAG